MRIVRVLLLCLSVVSLMSCEKKKSEVIPGVKSGEMNILEDPSVVGVSSASLMYDGFLETYIFTVPSGTDLTKLKLNIKVSPGAIVSPNPAETLDYSAVREFTITAENGYNRKFKVVVYNRHVYGKTCMLRRIELGDYHVDFSYNDKGQVLQIDALMRSAYRQNTSSYHSLTCLYDDKGRLTEASMEEKNFRKLVYKPIYENGKLVRIAYRSISGEIVLAGAIYVSTDQNNHLASMDVNKTICHSFYDVNDWVKKIMGCSASYVWAYQYFDKNSPRYFLASQIDNPAFLAIFYHFIGSFTTTGMLDNYFGQFVPFQRTEFFSGNLQKMWKRTTISSQQNADKFPIELQVKHETGLNTDWPSSFESQFKFYYYNCN